MIVHFDCFSGISGDMVLGALIDSGVPVEVIRSAIDSLSLPIQLEVERVKKCGIAATKVNVIADDQESYRFLPDIEAIIAAGNLTAMQRELAMSIFRIVAEAEATVHGIAIEKVHFHEVGALDSIADIVGAAVGLDHLNVTRFTCSPVVVGSGMVKCEHGLMPVPAPATARILHGIPLAATTAKGELCTPTGAAILKAVVSEFTATPAMTINRIGYGAGTKELMDQPNVVRMLIGESTTTSTSAVTLLETNLDDCTGEVLGYTMERLFEAGALDVSYTPIQMKKNRPGVMVSVIVEPGTSAVCELILFRETGTFGLRKQSIERVTLNRASVTVETKFGPIRAKRGNRDGHEITTLEYDDCARIAKEQGIAIREIYSAFNSLYSPSSSSGSV